jgi:hypothetical protein
MTAEQLLKKARECEVCGKPHKPWRSKEQPALAPQWSMNGHPYRARIDLGVIAKLELLATR